MKFLLLLVLLPAVVLSQCLTDDDKKVSNDVATGIALYKGQQKFSVDLLRTLLELYPGQNLFVSPHSIYQSLLLAYIASSNETELVIQRGLNLPPDQTKLATAQSYRTEKYFQTMREEGGVTDYEYKTCNKIFLSKKLTLKQCMSNLLKDELKELDFESNPEGARKQINDWVEETTKRHIKNLVPEEAVDSNTKMILANAAYFKGLWKSRFPPEQTKKNDIFHMDWNERRHVDMMRQKGMFNHMVSERLKAHILQLPYKGDDISMFILLPRLGENAIENVAEELTIDALQDIISSDGLFPRPVEVRIPKFTIEQTYNLRPLFSKLGLSEIFNETADFSTLTGTDEIHFDDGVHKAKIELDEDGTVAAAATAIFTFRSSRPLEPTIFNANTPFIYFIFDKVSQNILFIGVYRIPDKKYPDAKKT